MTDWFVSVNMFNEIMISLVCSVHELTVLSLRLFYFRALLVYIAYQLSATSFSLPV